MQCEKSTSNPSSNDKYTLICFINYEWFFSSDAMCPQILRWWPTLGILRFNFFCVLYVGTCGSWPQETWLIHTFRCRVWIRISKPKRFHHVDTAIKMHKTLVSWPIAWTSSCIGAQTSRVSASSCYLRLSIASIAPISRNLISGYRTKWKRIFVRVVKWRIAPNPGLALPRCFGLSWYNLAPTLWGTGQRMMEIFKPY